MVASRLCGAMSAPGANEGKNTMNSNRHPLSARLSSLATITALGAAITAHAGIVERDYIDTTKWDVGDYVQDNLVLHYDGIRNVGATEEHSMTTAVWNNLAQTAVGTDYHMDWVSYTGENTSSLTRSKGDTTQGEWNENGFVFNGRVCWMKWNNDSGKSPVSITPEFTMQFAMTANTADQIGDNATGYLFTPHSDYDWSKGGVALRNTVNDVITPANAVYAVDSARLGDTNTRPNFQNESPRYATVMSDSSAYMCFEETTLPSSGTSGYATLSTTPSTQDNNWIAIGGLGKRTTATPKNFQGFNGTLHNYRLYSVALTEAQLKQNRIVDDARFFGIRAPIATTNVIVCSTYSYLDGTEPQGFYAVDSEGHTFTAPSANVIAANGITYHCIGHTLETWSDATESWGDPFVQTGIYSVQIASTDYKRITWLWEAVSGIRTAADYSLADYSPAGLVLHYDGIFNDGAGKAHSTTATRWQNLVPGWEDQAMYWVSYRQKDNQDDPDVLQADRYNQTKGKWNATSGFAFDGYECWMKWNEGKKFVVPPAYTWQFAMEASLDDLNDNNGQLAYLFMPYSSIQWMNGSVAMRQTANGSITPANAIFSTDEGRFGAWNTGERPYFTNANPRNATILATSTSMAAFEGGTIPTSAPGLRTHTNNPLAVSRTNNWFAIGGQYKPAAGDTVKYFQSFRGTLHSVRFYNRPITQEEAVRNFNTDSARYFGALAVTNFVVEVEQGKDFDATPAPGAYFVEGSYEFTATAGADGAPTGYRLQDWDEATGQWANPRYCDGTDYTHDVSASAAKVKLTWCKRNPFVITVR